VIPDTTLRETLIAVICGVLILAFLVYGVMTMGARQQKASGNTLSGEVVGKKFIPAPEEQITFGSKGIKAQQIAGEYLLEVRVKGEERVFEVPVDPATYETARQGDTQTFLRPKSEQR
jgi:hypothetical protein